MCMYGQPCMDALSDGLALWDGGSRAGGWDSDSSSPLSAAQRGRCSAIVRQPALGLQRCTAAISGAGRLGHAAWPRALDRPLSRVALLCDVPLERCDANPLEPTSPQADTATQLTVLHTSHGPVYSSHGEGMDSIC